MRVAASIARWTVQVIHVVLGLGAIGQAENLAFRIGRRLPGRRAAAGQPAVAR